MLAINSITCPVLLIKGIDVIILWAGLAKRSKEISCSRNLVAARDFYDARRTFYASSYENLIEKKCETCHSTGTNVLQYSILITQQWLYGQ